MSRCPNDLGFSSKIGCAPASRSERVPGQAMLLAAFRARTAHVVALGPIGVEQTHDLSLPALHRSIEHGCWRRCAGSGHSDFNDLHGCSSIRGSGLKDGPDGAPRLSSGLGIALDLCPKTLGGWLNQSSETRNARQPPCGGLGFRLIVRPRTRGWRFPSLDVLFSAT